VEKSKNTYRRQEGQDKKRKEKEAHRSARKLNNGRRKLSPAIKRIGLKEASETSVLEKKKEREIRQEDKKERGK